VELEVWAGIGREQTRRAEQSMRIGRKLRKGNLSLQFNGYVEWVLDAEWVDVVSEIRKT